MTFSSGDRILTLSGRAGTITEPSWEFPGHRLVTFDTGEVHWIRESLIEHLPIGWQPPKKTRSKGVT